MTEFKDLGLADPILRALDGAGYKTPTPIQGKLIPQMLAGKDVVGIAQTGTGKTAAFVLPLLNEIAASTSGLEKRRCKTLIVTPTRELAAQIADNVAIYGKHIKHRCAVVVGGVKPNPQVRAMANGVDILVATPGRLLDHMSTGVIRIDKTTTVILDEADQMLDLGFLPAIRKIMSNLPRERRTALLSATMPKQIRGLASDFLHNPVEITVTPNSKPIERIDQRVIFVPKRAKATLLIDILGETAYERTIVFTRTKHGADKVAKRLDKSGFPAAAIHGNKSQNQRKRALEAFKKGTTGILVATDIAARGIDVDDVSHVFNFDLPNVPESYVHRIGRTARAGKEGTAIAFCDGEERSLLRDIERLIGTSLPKEDAPAEYGDLAKELEERAKANGGGNRGGNGGRGRGRSGGGRSGGGRSGGNKSGQGGQRSQGSGSGRGNKSGKPNKNRRRPNRNNSGGSRG